MTETDIQSTYDGGPAFPFPTFNTGNGTRFVGSTGMPLRDYFAAKALAVIYMDADDDEHSAQRAYELADAMLKARAR